MDLSYGFYNSQNQDRKYNATDFTKIFDGIIQDGVFQTIGDHFQVIQNTGSDNECKVKTGKAWLDHTYTVNNIVQTLSFDVVNVELYSRIDAVVIEVNKTTRTNDIKVIKGVESDNPVKPSLEDPLDANNKRYALAYITLKGSENITVGGDSMSVVKNENIENNVGANNNTDATHPLLPYVAGAMQVFDSETVSPLVNQMYAAIEYWFENEKDTLSSDAAVHLQEEIDDLIVVGTDPLTSLSQLDNGKIYLQYEE